MSVLRNIGAVIVGILAGGSAVALIEYASSSAHPMPAGIDMSDRQALGDWINSLPLSAYATVLAAWCTGAFLSVWVARTLAAQRAMWPGVVAGCFLLLATIANLIAIPHPLVFALLGLAVYPVFGLLGLMLSAPSEMSVEAERAINADVGKVFHTLADIRNFSNAVPGITNVEFLSEQQFGVGTRFRETRVMNGREAATELEVTELVENEHVRLVSHAGGTLWDTVFAVTSLDDATEMTMVMKAIPENLLARLMVPAILPMVSKAVQSDMDSVKDYCESDA